MWELPGMNNPRVPLRVGKRARRLVYLVHRNAR